jgi:hypothetical protein
MMKSCAYRFTIADPDRFGCDNIDDLIHNGTVARCVCEACPFAATPGNFFTQTAKLLIRRQHSGEYRPTAKGCGHCPEVKRRKPDQPFDLQFVWPYWHAGANGDEIRFSVRSVEKFYDGRAKCTIIGDKPPWFNGHYIAQQRVPKRTQARSYRDMLTKVWTMATHPEIDTDFVWMMDDVYFVKPFTLDQIAVPRAEKWHESDYNTWQRLKTASMQALTAAGLTNHDYATHLPHYVEREKLVELFQRYDLHNQTLLWEVLYGNTYRDSPTRARPFFARVGKPMESEQLGVVTRRATVLNHTAYGWCEGIRSFLVSLMPDMASVEIDAEAHPTIRPAKRSRIVKRRPVETHRAFTEAQR